MEVSMDFSKLNFDEFKQRAAKFDADATCGHGVERGDIVGYSKRHGLICAFCWQKWKEQIDERRKR
jgi:hypothetical protein